MVERMLSKCMGMGVAFKEHRWMVENSSWPGPSGPANAQAATRTTTALDTSFREGDSRHAYV